MRFADALADLDARQPERMIPDLTRIGALAELLGEPQRTYPTIHVTGTNGKTTTTRLLSGIACAHGLSAGAYTSPHLLSVTERIALCGAPISEEDFAEGYGRLLPYLEEVDRRGERVTYFEALTALAFVWFADRPVSVGVFEVGMGGTWDATNLIEAGVAVITPIDLDHPELGPTVKDVAGEKAGVIEDGATVVVREQPADALEVIEARCRESGARLMLEGRDWSLSDRAPAVGGQVLWIRGIHAVYADFPLPLFGEHQGRNAAAAVVGMEAFIGRALDEEALREALETASSPGRLEIAGRHPLVVLDGAHNPAGARALAAALRENFTWLDLSLVIACSANKDVGGIVGELAPLATSAFATRNSSPRSADAEDVARVCREAGIDTESFGSVPEALDAARGRAREEDLILVAGSLYTVADARRALDT